MEKDGIISQTDSVLIPFLESNGSAIENELTKLLLQHIQPEIEKNLRFKMHVSLKKSDYNPNNQDALEIAGEAKLLAVTELGKLRLNQNGKTIQNLKSYVTTLTINTYQQHLRKKYPLWQQLKNKLRYLLTHYPEFALWENDEGWFCGFKQISGAFKPENYELLQTKLTNVIKQNNLSDKEQLISLVRSIFLTAKSPIYFNDLVKIIAENQGIKDHSLSIDNGFHHLNDSVRVEDKILNKIEQQEYLSKVWKGISALPVRHRSALLLNLKDQQGNCLIHFLPILRIASIRQIAEILEIPADEFAFIWRELPWDDLKIAEHLRITRQQVINLRQSARASLLRQLKNL